jgi:threonine dehydratase
MNTSFDSILEAHVRIKTLVHRTSVVSSSTFDRLAGAQVFFKCENLQRSGSFKARGAMNAVFSLEQEAARFGVAAHSSGNHGAALALAARERGISAYVVVPKNSSPAKVAAIQRYGGIVSYCEPTLTARESAVLELIRQTGAALVHPFDNHHVISGQGTAALELLEDHPEISAVIAPVSGGGLLSGTCLAAHGSNSRVLVFGAEPSAADDAARSLASGRIELNASTNTIADGLRGGLAPRTFDILRGHVEAIACVSEEEIIIAMRLFWDIFKLVIEPSAAVVVAALANRRLAVPMGPRIGAIITGGNTDLDSLPW